MLNNQPLEVADETGMDEPLAIHWVYLVSDDSTYGDKLGQHLEHFGYHLQLVGSIGKLENMLAEHRTTAVIIDLSKDNGEMQHGNVIEQIHLLQDELLPPIIFIADVNDQKLRLAAVRAGGQAFFLKPVNVVSLIDKIDSFRHSEVLLKSRILILSQPTLTSYYQLILNRGGFITDGMTETSQLLEKMEEYRPDLLLIDISSSVSRIEIFKMIRQIESFVGIPIIFLMSDSEDELQTELMRLGGDDFLRKPVRANQLLTTVQNRIKRSKTLRSLMVRDSLTGLLNHTNFREQLNQILNYVRRQEGSLALAMVDLDRFKLVNDTYGHSVGDSVLKSLSRLLLQRLRKSDIIGRYGGEEFVVGLLDVHKKQALKVLNEIRTHFSQLQHFSHNEGKFRVTFSGGIAMFPEFPDAIALSDAADRALYAAKDAGRNRILIANNEAKN
jgi:diguanylate cyclase (GGDEF)-like protein